jgi:hypothetical protein
VRTKRSCDTPLIRFLPPESRSAVSVAIAYSSMGMAKKNGENMRPRHDDTRNKRSTKAFTSNSFRTWMAR